ncbi:MAG: hypothetical protein M3R65_11625 [Gemmatimonadota bacterium]|nr:hypothetical protein [Gemmatimonadota bacterium]
MRDDLRVDIPTEQLLEALLAPRIVIRADRQNASFPSGQTAIVTSALLAARCGAQIFLDIPEVPLAGPQPPIQGKAFLSGMTALGNDLMPGRAWTVGLPRERADLTLLIGDTPPRTHSVSNIAVSGNEWAGSIGSTGTRWHAMAPIGALAAAGLVAGEVFKSSMRRLRSGARNHYFFDQMFAPVSDALVRLAPVNTPVPRDFGEFDCVSGGAITHALLFALSRFCIAGDARVIEPDINDVTNLNRYSMLRLSRLGVPKALDLASMLLGEINVSGIAERYDTSFSSKHGSLRSHVLVGVDHIPTRWAVQASSPSWLGIGASSHYSAMASYHTAATPCARCLHPTDDELDGLIPTVSFVSHWAGLWLATIFALECAGAATPAAQQSTYATLLRPDLSSAIFRSGVSRRACCARCTAVVA